MTTMLTKKPAANIIGLKRNTPNAKHPATSYS